MAVQIPGKKRYVTLEWPPTTASYFSFYYTSTCEGLRSKKIKNEFAPHREIDVDNICQWQNGLIQMDHITPHTGHFDRTSVLCLIIC